jgi:hypothetical protein
MHMGRHLAATQTVMDTLSLRQVSAFVLDSQGDPALPGIVVGPGSTLEFWHLISVLDDENFGDGFIPAGTSFGGGQVQISPLGPDGKFERWQRLTPAINGYDSVIQETISLCGFDPGDDVIVPANETMCDHSPMWADLGDVFGTDATCFTDTDHNDSLHKDCGVISGCTPGPGCTENGSLGTGVWARSTFDLSAYAGRVARLRWIGMVEGGWSFGTDRSALETDNVSYQYFDGDDGWWIDDIVLKGLQRSPGPCAATDDDGDGFSECQGDCDDTRPTVYRGAPQVCDDGINNDCDDPMWPLGAREEDADGDGVVGCLGDCDDTRADVRPGAPQICDGRNNDCNDPAWPAVPPNERDADGDTVRICAGDCDDTHATVYPGALERCDGLNNDCNSPTWPYTAESIDADGDGWIPCQNDCDDNDPTAYPGAPELCDGKRNNCSVAWFGLGEIDNDGDGLAECQNDCNDASSTSWAPPGDVTLSVSFNRGTGVTTFSWDPPAVMGGTQVLYDLLESTQPYDFWSSVCLLTDDPWDTTYQAPPVLPWPDLRFYLVRAQNACPGTNTGSLGADSNGAPRFGRDCRF